jgi:hypothetical protein
VRQTFTPAAFEEFALAKLASEEGRMEFGKALDTVNSFASKLRAMMYKSFDQMIGILSLSETWDNAPMWAHYANQHKGFVIGFDGSNEYFHRRRYEDAPTEVPSFSDLNSGTKIFLTKDKSWANEREWRMLAPLPDASVLTGQSNDPVHLFHLPGSTIQSVIIGARASDELTSSIARILHGSTSLAHVKMLQSVVDDDRGGLRLVPSISTTS